MNNPLTLLGLIRSGSGYGYDLKQSFDQYFNLSKPLAFGQVYAILSRMIRDGLIESTGGETGGGPSQICATVAAQIRSGLDRSPEALNGIVLRASALTDSRDYALQFQFMPLFLRRGSGPTTRPYKSRCPESSLRHPAWR